MLNIPEINAHVRVWPAPGRRVQLDARPPDQWGGGRFLPAKGATVVWSYFHVEQLRAGEILLHHPPCEKHVFQDGGDDECLLCGRTMAEAQDYDVKCMEGCEAAKKEATTLPKHPLELKLHPHSAAMKAVRSQEAKSAEARAKAAAEAEAAEAAKAVADAAGEWQPPNTPAPPVEQSQPAAAAPVAAEHKE